MTVLLEWTTTKPGGVGMQESRWAPERDGMREAVRVAVGIALLVLATGVWVCLWVPPF
jgi:hypothetical protein